MTMIDFNEIPKCIRWCQCEQKVLTIEPSSDFNYPGLMLYNQYDLQAWSFFMEYKRKNFVN